MKTQHFLSHKEQPVKVYVKSTISDLIVADMVDSADENGMIFDEDSGEMIPADELSGQIDDVIEYMSEGTLTEDGNVCTLLYQERKDMGFDNSRTSLSFDRDQPDIVTLVRTGDVSTVCRFDMAHPRQICSYDGGVMPMEIAFHTHRVHNALTQSGGTIDLDYTIEVHGVRTERSRFFIEVRPAT